MPKRSGAEENRLSDSSRDPARDAPAAVPSVVNSPCIRVCVIDSATGWCRGCLRTLDEIASWSGMDNGGKHAVMDRVAVREQQKPEWKIKY